MALLCQQETFRSRWGRCCRGNQSGYQGWSPWFPPSGPSARTWDRTKAEQVSSRPGKPQLWDGVFVPEDVPDTGLQEALVRQQDDAVGHVEAVQQNRHTSLPESGS